MPERLDYEVPARRRRLEPHWAIFLPIYFICALSGLSVSPWAEILLWGKAGDKVLFTFKVGSIAIAMAIAGLLYASWPRHWIVARWLLATVGGFLSFAVAYLVLLVLFP